MAIRRLMARRLYRASCRLSRAVARAIGFPHLLAGTPDWRRERSRIGARNGKRPPVRMPPALPDVDLRAPARRPLPPSAPAAARLARSRPTRARRPRRRHLRELRARACRVHRRIAGRRGAVARPGTRRGRRARRHAQAFGNRRRARDVGAARRDRRAIEVAGIVARTRVTQRFVNPTPSWREGVYVFPLPDKAAVDHLRDRDRRARHRGRDAGARRGEAGLRRGARTGRQARRWSSRNGRTCSRPASRYCAPDEEVVVTIEYQETLRYDTGTFSLRFPLAVTPRYVPLDKLASLDGAEDAERVSMPFHPTRRAPRSPSRSSLDAGFPLASVESTTTRSTSSRAADAPLRASRSPTASCRPTATSSSRGRPPSARSPPPRVFTEKRNGRRTRCVMVMPPSVPSAATDDAARGDVRRRHVGLDGRRLDRAGEGSDAVRAVAPQAAAIAST